MSIRQVQIQYIGDSLRMPGLERDVREIVAGGERFVRRGECEWVLEHSGTFYDKWRCSECGFLFVEPRCDQGYTDLEPNFCPKCGKKVRWL